MPVSVNTQIAGGSPRSPRVFSADTTITAGITSLSEQIIKQITIPAGTLTSCSYFEVQILWTKSGTTDSATSCRLRLGAAGTVADTSILSTAAFVAANRGFSSDSFFAASDATTLRNVTNNSLIGFSSALTTSAVPATVAVPNMTTNNLVLSACVTMAGTTDTPGIANILLLLY